MKRIFFDRHRKLYPHDPLKNFSNNILAEIKNFKFKFLGMRSWTMNYPAF